MIRYANRISSGAHIEVTWLPLYIVYKTLATLCTAHEVEHTIGYIGRYWVRIPVGALRNLGNFVYPVLPVSFVRDTISRWSLLPVAYVRGR